MTLDRSRLAMAESETFDCDCGATFESEEELKAHAREAHDADV